MVSTNILMKHRQPVGDAMCYVRTVWGRHLITVRNASRILDWFRGTVLQIVSKGSLFGYRISLSLIGWIVTSIRIVRLQAVLVAVNTNCME